MTFGFVSVLLGREDGVLLRIERLEVSWSVVGLIDGGLLLEKEALPLVTLMSKDIEPATEVIFILLSKGGAEEVWDLPSFLLSP